MVSVKATLTSIYVTWTALTCLDIPVQGYKLYMSKKGSGEFSLIYDGKSVAANHSKCLPPISIERD